MFSTIWYYNLLISIGIICIICSLFIPLCGIILLIRCQRKQASQEDPTLVIPTSSTPISTDIIINLSYYYNYASHSYTTFYSSINDSYTTYDAYTSSYYFLSTYIDTDLDGNSTDVAY